MSSAGRFKLDTVYGAEEWQVEGIVEIEKASCEGDSVNGGRGSASGLSGYKPSEG